MDVQQFSKCRVCLNVDTTKGISIFSALKGTLIAVHLMRFSDVNIVENDGLPDVICPKCTLILETLISFKQLCEASDASLRTQTHLQPLVKELDSLKKEETQLESDNDNDFINYECDPSDGYVGSPDSDKEFSVETELKPRIELKQCQQEIKRRILKRNCKASSNHQILTNKSLKKLKCPKCFKGFKKKLSFEKHIHNCPLTNSFSCDICSKQFRSKAGATYHKEKHSREAGFVCFKCGFVCKTRFNLSSHMSRKHGPVKFQCDLCKKTHRNKISMTAHIKRHYKVPSVCGYCEKQFYTLLHLHDHFNEWHSNQPYIYKCPSGEATFINHKLYVSHMKAHANGFTYCCRAKCKKMFKDKKDLEEHKKLHKDIIMRCPYCGIPFTDKRSLWNHARRSHKNESEKDDFHSKLGYKKLRSREEGAYKCPYCVEKFASPFSVKRHVASKHPEANKQTDDFKIFSHKNTNKYCIQMNNEMVIFNQNGLT